MQGLPQAPQAPQVIIDLVTPPASPRGTVPQAGQSMAWDSYFYTGVAAPAQALPNMWALAMPARMVPQLALIEEGQEQGVAGTELLGNPEYMARLQRENEEYERRPPSPELIPASPAATEVMTEYVPSPARTEFAPTPFGYWGDSEEEHNAFYFKFRHLESPYKSGEEDL